MVGVTGLGLRRQPPTAVRSAGATLAGVVLRLGDHGLDRRRLAAALRPARAPGEARDARCPQCEIGFVLAVSDTHPGQGKDHKPADGWQSDSGQRRQRNGYREVGRACRRNDRTPIGMAPLDAGGAIPGSDVVAPKVIRPSVATPVFLLLSGLPGRCCSVGSCGCGGGVTIAAGLPATGTMAPPRRSR